MEAPPSGVLARLEYTNARLLATFALCPIPQRLAMARHINILAAADSSVPARSQYLWYKLRTHSWTEVQTKAGALAVIHFLPLCTGMSFSLPADLLHIDRQTFAWLHRWFGRLCVLQSLLHSSMLVSVARKSTLATSRYMVPLVVRERHGCDCNPRWTK